MTVHFPTSTYTFAFGAPSIDEEEKEIMSRLRMYGANPTGDKSIDRAKLRQIEERKAKENNFVSGKFFTVSRNEEEKIQEKKKEQRALGNPDYEKESKKLARMEEKKRGAKLLGEQTYLVIQLKSDKKDNKKINEENENYRGKNIGDKDNSGIFDK